MYRYLPAIMMLLATAAAAGLTWVASRLLRAKATRHLPLIRARRCQEQTKSSCIPIVTDLGEQVPDLIMACRIVVLL